MTSRVPASSPNDTHTWVNTTSFSTSAPGTAAMPSASARARATSPSTRSATPARPSDRNTTQTGTPRARRDISGTLSKGSATSEVWKRLSGREPVPDASRR